jgi:hypothetical protein
MARREKIQSTPIVKDNKKFLYYIKDGKVFRVPKKQTGVAKGRSEMQFDAKLTQDPDYIYFVDEDGDIARVPRAKGGRKTRKTRRKAVATKTRSKAKPKPKKGRAKRSGRPKRPSSSKSRKKPTKSRKKPTKSRKKPTKKRRKGRAKR